jgi:hypothetical protein
VNDVVSRSWNTRSSKWSLRFTSTRLHRRLCRRSHGRS